MGVQGSKKIVEKFCRKMTQKTDVKSLTLSELKKELENLISEFEKMISEK